MSGTFMLYVILDICMQNITTAILVNVTSGYRGFIYEFVYVNSLQTVGVNVGRSLVESTNIHRCVGVIDVSLVRIYILWSPPPVKSKCLIMADFKKIFKT